MYCNHIMYMYIHYVYTKKYTYIYIQRVKMNEYDIKKIRKYLQLTQKELASELKLTQATISRIESGKQLPSKETIIKLNQLISTQEKIHTEEPITKRDLYTIPIPLLNLSGQYKEMGEGLNSYYATNKIIEENGDLIILKDNKNRDYIPFIIADTVGHGKNAAFMSFAVRFAYEACQSIFNTASTNIDFFNTFLKEGLRSTKDYWPNSPSLINGVIYKSEHKIEFINEGMPFPLKFGKNETTFLKKREAAFISLNQKTYRTTREFIKLEKGESLIMFSDGLLDIFNEKDIVVFLDSMKIFRGDSRAIGKNILKKINNKYNNINDDISYLIISRSQE